MKNARQFEKVVEVQFRKQRPGDTLPGDPMYDELKKAFGGKAWRLLDIEGGQVTLGGAADERVKVDGRNFVTYFERVPVPASEEKKAFEMPGEIPFEQGEKIRWKEQPDVEYTVFGYVPLRQVIRLFDGQGNPLDIPQEDISEFEKVVSPQTP